MIWNFRFTHYQPFSDEVPDPLDVVFHDAAYRAEKLLAHRNIRELDVIATHLERILRRLPPKFASIWKAFNTADGPETVIDREGVTREITHRPSMSDLDDVAAAFRHDQQDKQRDDPGYVLSEYLAVYALLCINLAKDDSLIPPAPTEEELINLPEDQRTMHVLWKQERRELMYTDYCGDFAGEAASAIRMAEAARERETIDNRRRILNTKAANVKHAPVAALKREAYEFYLTEKYPSFQSAAEAFFDALPKERQELLSEDNAVETLARAIGKQLRNDRS